MKKALTLLGMASIIFVLGLIGCNENTSNDDPLEGQFGGSDAIVKEFRIGNVPITTGGTFNVPLGEVNKLTFILNEDVDPISFVEFIDIKITVFNQDTGKFLVLTRPTMLENGSFYIFDNKRWVEYRLLHYMDRVWIGGVPIDDPPFATPGDTLEVMVDYASGRNNIGEWFAFKLDTFKVIFTESTP